MTTAELCAVNNSGALARFWRRHRFLKNTSGSKSLLRSGAICHLSSRTIQKGHEDVCGHGKLLLEERKPLETVIRCRKPFRYVSYNRVGSDCNIEPEVEPMEEDSHDLGAITPEMDEGFDDLSKSVHPHSPLDQSHLHNVKRKLVMLSLPAMASQAIDPLAQLMETAYIGRLGPIELASAGVSMSIFNIVSKLFNMPLLSVATSFVAEDIAKSSSSEGPNGSLHHGKTGRRQLSSVSTALSLAVGIGIIEALALLLGSGKFLTLMGVSQASPMYAPAQRFLSLRALGAPAVVLSLALQGVLRGFQDTKTPVFCLGVANLVAVFLFPLFINYLQMGVTGGALSTVISQYVGSFLMVWYLSKRAVLLPPKLGDLRFGVYLQSGGFLIGRTLAVLITTTFATSMAARQGPVSMAAHQICLQVWLAVSLLTDAFAASAQALIASSLSRRDYTTVKELTYFVLKIGILTGTTLALILGTSFGTIAKLFTKDAGVLKIVISGTLFVSASQPFNALAFIFDGLHYGASDFPYAARSMMLVGAISSVVLLVASSSFGLPGVWLGLTLFMALRAAVGYCRIQSKKGPWWFLHGETAQLAAV